PRRLHDQRMDRHFEAAFLGRETRHQPGQLLDFLAARPRQNEARRTDRLQLDDLRDPDLADPPLHLPDFLFSCLCRGCWFRRGRAMDHLPPCRVIRASLSERDMPELAISAEKLAFLIEKAREFDVKEAESDPDSGSNPADDDNIDVLEDNR